MENFEILWELAQKAGRVDLAQAAAERQKKIMEREKTGVFVTGGMNCGKTTILNGITGAELREPGLLSEEEEPLMVVFEKAEGQEGFECRTVANRQWNEEDAVLYEMKLSDIFRDDGKPKEILDLADMVFYVVSAVAPFTAADMNAVRAMSFLKVQVVLNKLDLLDESSAEKVENYIRGICGKLGIAAPLSLSGAQWEQTAKEFRFLLPSWKERELLRKEHVQAVGKEAAGSLAEAIQDQLSAQKARQAEEKTEHTQRVLETQEQQALWGKLRAQMLEQGDELLKQARKDIESVEAPLSQRLYESAKEQRFSESWIQEHIPRLMEEEMRALVGSRKKELEARMQEDCRKMMKRAVNLGLTTGFDLTDTDFILMTSVAGAAYCGELPKMARSGNPQTLLKAGIAAGLLLLLPIPTAWSLVGGAAAAGIGGSIYRKEKQEAEERFWQQQLKSYCQANLRNLKDALSQGIKEYYGKLADVIRKKAEAMEMPRENEGLGRDEARELEALLAQCRELLQ